MLLFALLACPRNVSLQDGYTPDRIRDDEAWGDVGDEHVAAGRTIEALDAYQRAWRLDPQDAEWQRKVAEVGGSAVFRAQVDLLLPDTFRDDEALGDRADAFKNASLLEEACALYRRAAMMDTEDGEWQSNVATCDAPPEAEMYGGLLGTLSSYGVEGGVSGTYNGLGTYDGVAAANAYVDEGAYGYDEAYTYGDYSGIGGLGTYAYTTAGRPDAVESALTHARAGEKPEARNALWVAVQADPYGTDLRVMWTMLTGESQAVLLQKLVDANASDPALWGALGDAKLAAGKRAEAVTAWQRAAALAPYDLTWGNRIEMAKLAPAPR